MAASSSSPGARRLLEVAEATAERRLHVFSAMVEPLALEGAMLDGYVGDGLLAHFEGDDRAGRAVRAAQRMRAALRLLNAAHPEREPVRVGIAVHAGPVLVVTIGAPERREYTLIGDAVHVTDRLEKYNKELGSVVIASEVALAGMADPGRLGFRGPRLVEVRGHDRPLAVHYVPEDAPLPP